METLLQGTSDVEIEDRCSVKRTFLFKAWCGSEYSRVCFTYCLGFGLSNFYLFISFNFFLFSSSSFFFFFLSPFLGGWVGGFSILF